MLALVAAGAVLADAPDTSLRPMPRPGEMAAVTPQMVGVAPQVAARPAMVRSLRPMPRPVVPANVFPVAALAPQSAVPTAPPAAPPASVTPQRGQAGLFGFLRPTKRPDGLNRQQQVAARVAPSAPGRQGVVSRKGAVCGDPAIMGEALAPITSRVQGCGVDNPVRITSVAGVRLSQPATVDCPTARALKTWVQRGVEPAYGKGRVVQLEVAGHYVCRTRNHRAGAAVSEHGKGRAIDISGFTFSDGKTVPVLKNFDRRMRKAHRAACGIFTTTLGPGSDGMHEDHLHFDTARRGSTYCR